MLFLHDISTSVEAYGVDLNQYKNMMLKILPIYSRKFDYFNIYADINEDI